MSWIALVWEDRLLYSKKRKFLNGLKKRACQQTIANTVTVLETIDNLIVITLQRINKVDSRIEKQIYRYQIIDKLHSPRIIDFWGMICKIKLGVCIILMWSWCSLVLEPVVGKSPLPRTHSKCDIQLPVYFPQVSQGTHLLTKPKRRMNSWAGYGPTARAGDWGRTRGFLPRRGNHCTTETHMKAFTNIECIRREKA